MASWEGDHEEEYSPTRYFFYHDLQAQEATIVLVVAILCEMVSSPEINLKTNIKYKPSNHLTLASPQYRLPK